MSKSIVAPILSSEYLRKGFSSSSPSKVMLPTYLFSGEFSGASIVMSLPFSRWITAFRNSGEPTAYSSDAGHTG